MVTGLDEVMDWPCGLEPRQPLLRAAVGHDRRDVRAARRGRGARRRPARRRPRSIAFAAAGLASDHEVLGARRGLGQAAAAASSSRSAASRHDRDHPGLLAAGAEDWSQIAFTTDDRSATRHAGDSAPPTTMSASPSQAGLAPEIAIQCATINPARHMRLDALGRLDRARPLRRCRAARGRRQPVDREGLGRRRAGVRGQDIHRPRAGNRLAATGRRGPMKSAATLSAADFAIAAPPGRDHMQAAVLRPFHWHEDFITMELPVADGAVQRDSRREHHQVRDRRPLLAARARSPRCSGAAAARATPDTALACSVGARQAQHLGVGSSDAAMAQGGQRACSEIQGGWVLVHAGEVAADGALRDRRADDGAPGGGARCRDAGALSPRPPRSTGCTSRPSAPRWKPGFPERLKFATLTCSPWRWVLVAPSQLAPQGFVNVPTGETHPMVW